MWLGLGRWHERRGGNVRLRRGICPSAQDIMRSCGTMAERGPTELIPSLFEPPSPRRPGLSAWSDFERVSTVNGARCRCQIDPIASFQGAKEGGGFTFCSTSGALSTRDVCVCVVDSLGEGGGGGCTVIACRRQLTSRHKQCSTISSSEAVCRRPDRPLALLRHRRLRRGPSPASWRQRRASCRSSRARARP